MCESPSLSAGELVAGYLAGAFARSAIVAAVIGMGMTLVLGRLPAHPVWVVVFVTLGAALLGGLGIVAGIIANKFDQMAAITNFIITPLSFLSGTFYSVQALPPLFRALTHANPIFYLIDGSRYGFVGVSDASPWTGLAVCLAAALAVNGLAWWWLKTGWRMKP